MEIINEDGYKPRKLKGLGFGIIMILIGVLLFGLNFGMIPEGFRYIFFSWQALIILVGIMHMVKKHQIIWGALWIAVGSFFLLPKIIRAFPGSFPDGIADNFTSAYWPLLIILFGVVVILNKYLFPVNVWRSKIETKIHEHRHDHTYNYQRRSGAFEKNSIFGGGEHIILDPVFSGGEINSVFGGLTLDLRRTNLAEGETVIEMNAVFGGVTLFIPGNWFVETRVDNVFGGFEDKRLIQEPIDKTRKLIITGACVFGGGEILS